MKVWRLTGKLISFRKTFVILGFITSIGWLLSRLASSFAIQEIIDTIVGEETIFNLDIKTLFIIIPFTYVSVFIIG
ncbi:MAG TPA: hypothetical protein VMX55_02295, partial [candidate division Zixibacteria bacterium]|nr:hypothetical protein [candidate division Zixibacteria bacterium]